MYPTRSPATVQIMKNLSHEYLLVCHVSGASSAYSAAKRLADLYGSNNP